MPNEAKRVLSLAAGIAGGAAAVGGASADGAIIAGQIQTNGSQVVSDTTTTPDESYPLDLNNDSLTDFTVASKYSKTQPGLPGDTTKFYTYKGDKISGSVDNGVGGIPVAFGDPIGPTTIFSSSTTVDYASAAGGPSGYYALRFGATTPVNYGWIQLREGDSPNAFDLIAYGYETTPDTEIAAGAIPEPTGLAALAIGAAAMLKRCGRRKA